MKGGKRAPFWTGEEDETAKAAYLAGEPLAAIGARLNRSPESVCVRLGKLGCRRTDEMRKQVARAKNMARRLPAQRLFDRNYIPEPNSGCWLWLGKQSGNKGYGAMLDDGVLRKATHVSLKLAGRPMSEGMSALHRCDNPFCVNPDHLFAGTQADNVHDMIRKGRHRITRGALGPANPAAKLTADQARLVRDDPRSAAEVAADFGIGRSNVYAIKKRKTWAHV